MFGMTVIMLILHLSQFLKLQFLEDIGNVNNFHVS
jgi:hypothetical protein